MMHGDLIAGIRAARWCLSAMLGVAGLAGGAAQTARADLLVADGQTALAVIVLPAVPSAEESLAGERLQHYVEQITGVELSIQSEADIAGASASGHIYIGRTNAAAPVLEDLARRNAPAESSLVVSDGDTVFITGVDPIGTLHATYFLLEDFGCRWYLPADWGTVIPSESKLVIPTQNKYRTPSFAIRSGMEHIGTDIGTDPTWDYAEWGRGNHLGGWRWWGAGHSYAHMVPKAQFEAHPEWFALVDGKRIPDQLCVTNPEGREFALKTVRAALKTYGDNPPELIYISPNDTKTNKFCQCESCQKYVPDKADGSGKDFSKGNDRVVAYANFFADSLREEYPNLRVTYYVDYHSYEEPTLVVPARNSVFTIAHWQGDQFHGENDKSQMGSAISRWGKFGCPMVARTYWGSHTSWSFWPIVHSIKVSIPYYHDKGFIGVYSETHQNWGAQHLNFIVYPRLLWDADLDVDAYVAEFCEKFYGPAAEPMLRYYTLLEKAAKDGPPQHRYRQTLIPTFTPKVLNQLRQCMDQAEEKLKDADEIYEKRMTFVRAGFDLGDLYFSAENLIREYPSKRDPAIRERAVEILRKSVEIMDDPQFKDHSGIQQNHLVASVPWEMTHYVREMYERHAQGTRFAPGAFNYFDDFYLGSRTFVDAESRTGFKDGKYGLYLEAGVTGSIVYRFDAREGVLNNVTGKLVLNRASKDAPAKLEARIDAGSAWTEASIPQDVTGFDFDLSAIADGQQTVWLRITITNPSSTDIHALHQLHLNGEVVTAK